MQTGDHGSGGRRTAIIVSGMHRSGTSAITRVISMLGAALPQDLIEGRGDNERGFWEGRAVVDLDDRALDRFGSWWGGWDRIDPDELRSLVRLVERARRLVRAQFARDDLVVLKDPRMSRLLPLWTRALEQEGFRCAHVVVVRHPGAVAGSLGRRNGLSREAATLSWLAHSLDAELHTRAQPRVVVSFERFVRDWHFEMTRIARALSVDWPHPPEEVAGAVGEFVEPGLVHEPPASALQGPVAAVGAVYDALRSMAEDGDGADHTGTLDSWRAVLEPVRAQRSAVALLSLERREVIADAETRNRPVGPLGSAQVWAPLQYEAHNIEAAGAWSWLCRERRHAGAAGRSAREIAALRQSLDEYERSRGLTRAVSRLSRRLPFPRQVTGQAPVGPRGR